jgi:hypothetical protein
MSHPIASRTYEDDVLGQWTDEEIENLWKLYQEQCRQSKLKATMSDFIIFLEERI